MSPFSLAGPLSWPQAALLITVLAVVAFLVTVAVSTVLQTRRLRVDTARLDDLRQLVERFERLAENTLDAQQRAAADLAELRSRTASIEQILRTVE